MSYATLTGLFTAIADALRGRTGSSAAIAAQDFPAAITALPSGGDDTSDATATAADILRGKTAYAGGTKLTGTHADLFVPKHRENITNGYISTNWWSLSSQDYLLSDVYRVYAGHIYQAVLGATVGNRMRVALFPSDPALATSNLEGSLIGNSINNPSPFERCSGVCAPSADGYLTIFKNSSADGLNAQSYVLELSAL